MDKDDPTCVMKMIKDLRSVSDAFRCEGRSSLRLSSAVGPPLSSLDDDDDDDDERKFSTPKRPRLDESTNSVLNKTNSDSAPGSPWEWRRLKGEVVSLRTRLSQQEATIQKLHKIRREMEEVFEKEKNLLEMQAEQDKQTIKQLEQRIDVARRSMQEVKETQSRVERESIQLKVKLEQEMALLLNENTKLREDLRQSTVREPRVPKDLHNESLDSSSNLQVAETRILQLEEKLREHMLSQKGFELQNVELQNLKIKVEKLESERALWEEGKSLTSRAARASDLEKELNVAKETIASLKEAVRGKLLLEEQMSNAMQRLEHSEKVEQQVATLEAKQSELLIRLSEYESIGVTGGGPSSLKRELSRLQQAEAILTAEEGQLRSKVDAMQRECQNLQRKYDEAKKIAAETTASREKSNMLVRRLQKKMILVTRERDSYRQQLDAYEKEITIGGSSGESSNAIERIPALERAIDGYRELVDRLESDLDEDRGTRGECQRLREEVEMLKAELERRAPNRVLHMRLNPTAMAERQAEEKRQALVREMEELRAAGSGAILGGSSLYAQEIAELKQTHEIKIARLKDAFKSSSQEYRQACYQLFGWRVDRIKEGRYRLSSQYAESPEDFLLFHVREEGVDLLETMFSATLGTSIEQYLEGQHSVPMFLCAVQTELFAQQTVMTVG